MSDPAQLYEEDFVRWAETQARALRDAARSGANLPLDWENLAEEVEDLGKTRRRELNSLVTTIIEHLLKLRSSSADEPRRGWGETIIHARDLTGDLLDENPSLRRCVPEAVEAGTRRAKALVAASLRLYGETLPDDLGAATYTDEQVLGDWFPGETIP
jgi:hypothetical protein